MKLKVIQEDGTFAIYSLSIRLLFNLELFKRLDEAELRWEYIL